MPQREKDIAFFVVWVLNKAAKRWGTTPSEVYRKLEAAGIVSGHLVGFYDTVQTMGEQAILDDLSQLAEARGVAARWPIGAGRLGLGPFRPTGGGPPRMAR